MCHKLIKYPMTDVIDMPRIQLLYCVHQKKS
jgi:hypothetical protein